MNVGFREKLQEKGLKVTPQRVAIFEAILKLDNHPTADDIISFIKTNHPNISVGTVYKVLDTLVENNLLKKVKTEILGWFVLINEIISSAVGWLSNFKIASKIATRCGVTFSPFSCNFSLKPIFIL